MAFPPKLLNEGEEIVLDLSPHWSTLAKPVGLLIVLVATTVGVIAATSNQYARDAFGVALLLTAAWTAARVMRRQTTEFVVTTHRLVYRQGVVAKRGKEIPLERVNDISFNQSIWERMIGTGDLSIESAGAQSRETFSDIPGPSRVQNEIYKQMEAAEARHADRVAGRTQLSLPEQLEKLDELRQRGVLTQAEFEAKKQQLLDRM